MDCSSSAGLTPRMLRRQLLCCMVAIVITIALLLSYQSSSGPRLWVRAQSSEAHDHQSIQQPLDPDAGLVPSTPSTSLPGVRDFPRTIWQTGSTDGIKEYAKQSQTWSTQNPNHTHVILTDKDANDFVQQHFPYRPSLLRFWNELRVPVLRADLLRYLVILSRGGVYSDIDTSCLMPITQWIPAQYRLSANAVVGIEYDDSSMKMFVRPISFNQWTLMAKPGHPIFERAAARVISNLEFLARQKRQTLSNLKLEMVETLEATGPGMITDVVMEVLRDQGHNVDWKTFHALKEPMLLGDVLILPINGFAGHQKHSHSGDPAFGPKLVQHHFGRTWYRKKPTPEPEQEQGPRKEVALVKEEQVEKQPVGKHEETKA